MARRNSGPISDWSLAHSAGSRRPVLPVSSLSGCCSVPPGVPCTGPTLGAASLLAAQGKDLGSVGLTMLLFGIGAALPMLLLGFMSRELLMRVRDRMIGFGKGAKFALGASLALVAMAIMTGFDRDARDVAHRRDAGFARRARDKVLKGRGRRVARLPKKCAAEAAALPLIGTSTKARDREDMWSRVP